MILTLFIFFIAAMGDAKKRKKCVVLGCGRGVNKAEERRIPKFPEGDFQRYLNMLTSVLVIGTKNHVRPSLCFSM